MSMSNASLIALLIEAKSDEYKELCDRWRDLDSKAQALITVTGVLLTGFLAFTSTNWKPVTGYERLWFSSVVLLFVGSILTNASELWIRKVDEPPNVESLVDIVNDLLKTPELDRDKREVDFCMELLALWEECNVQVRCVIKQKVRALGWGQVLTAAPVVLLLVPAVNICLR